MEGWQGGGGGGGGQSPAAVAGCGRGAALAVTTLPQEPLASAPVLFLSQVQVKPSLFQFLPGVCV